MIKVDVFCGRDELERGLNKIERDKQGNILQILVHTIPDMEYRPAYTVIYRVKDNDGH